MLDKELPTTYSLTNVKKPMGYFSREPVNHDVWILNSALRRTNNEMLQRTHNNQG